MLFVHGFSDHCHNYDYFFNRLAESGIEVYAFDQRYVSPFYHPSTSPATAFFPTIHILTSPLRGWGHTVTKPSERGLSGPTKTVLSDITSMLRTLLPSPVPVFLMGHSMGGAETLVYATQGPPLILSQIRGFIASAPLIALHPDTRPWKLTVVLGRLAGKLLPRRQLVNHLDAKWLSHDEELNAAWAADERNHDTGTLEGLAGMLDRAEQLDSGAVMVKEGTGEGGKTRLLVLHGTDDHINDFEASRKYVARCGVADKELKAYEGLYHNSKSGLSYFSTFLLLGGRLCVEWIYADSHSKCTLSWAKTRSSSPTMSLPGSQTAWNPCKRLRNLNSEA